MHIKPEDKTIRALLESTFFKIPRFQRPYSWDAENVEDFWNDTIESGDSDYFIGSFVVYRESDRSDVSAVVDGQQRLTTITLLLAALRNELTSLRAPELASGIQRLIERKDVDDSLRFVVESETPYPYFQTQVQSSAAPNSATPASTEERAIAAAFAYLSDRVRQVATTGNQQTKRAQVKRLVGIRNRVLSLSLICITLGTEEDAYQIFETLNTRGKDLRVADLIKNHFLRVFKPRNRALDVTKDTWRGIQRRLDSADEKGALNINSFLHHSWLSRYEYTSEKRLYKVFRRRVRAATAEQALKELDVDSKLYRKIMFPTAGAWDPSDVAISRSLHALIRVFRVVQPVPLLLSVLRAYQAKGIRFSQARDALAAMERFHVQFTAVTAQRTGGGTALMYASAAKSLSGATDTQVRARLLRDFEKKLRARVPSEEEFVANFSDLFFTSDQTRQKSLVQYLLRGLHGAENQGPIVDYDQMTIEHILPERPDGGLPEDQQEAVGMMGNLLLVTEAQNEELKNKTFSVKKGLYEKWGFTLDPTLRQATKWGVSQIQKRTEYLAGRARHVYKV